MSIQRVQSGAPDTPFHREIFQVKQTSSDELKDILRQLPSEPEIYCQKLERFLEEQHISPDDALALAKAFLIDNGSCRVVVRQQPILVKRIFNQLITGLFRQGGEADIKWATNFLNSMGRYEDEDRLISPDIMTYGVAMKWFFDDKCPNDAVLYYEQMCAQGLHPDRAVYTILIKGCHDNGRCDKAARYYEEMRTLGMCPDGMTYDTVKGYFNQGLPGATTDFLTDLLCCGDRDMVVGAIFPRVKNTGALSLGNRNLYRVVHHVEGQREYSRLKLSLDFIRNQKEILSEDQESVLFGQEEVLSKDQESASLDILSQVERAIEDLSKGPKAIEVGGDRVNQIKRAIAAILSEPRKGVQRSFPKSLKKLRMPKNKDSVRLLVRELKRVASAYAVLLGHCGMIHGFHPSLKETVKPFEEIPRHYLQHVFDLIETRQDIKKLRRIIPPFLGEIHKMLCEQGETGLAKLVRSKTSDLREQSLSDQKNLEMDQRSRSTILSLGRMLLYERGPKSVVEMIYELYSARPKTANEICDRLGDDLRHNKEYDLARSLTEEYTSRAPTKDSEFREKKDMVILGRQLGDLSLKS